jgi:hypothetical protein
VLVHLKHSPKVRHAGTGKSPTRVAAQMLYPLVKEWKEEDIWY